jgi:hypothetical protein
MKREITPWDCIGIAAMLDAASELVRCLERLEHAIKHRLDITGSDDQANDHVTDAIHLPLTVPELLKRLHIDVTEQARNVH